jgi:hypothetical protein
LVNIPVGYQDGFLYNIKPEDNTLGFRFNRDSAATRVNKEGLIEQVGYFGPELVQNGDFSQLGPELVVNGDFATDSNWTKGAGWSISGGVATLDGTQVGSSGLSSTLMPVVSGKTYKIVVNVLSKSSGFRLYDNYGVIAYGLSVGENVFYRTALSSSNYQIIPLGLSGSTGSIDNISVKQVDPNNYWTLGIGWSFGDNVASSDGTQAGNSSLFQGNVLTQNKFYKFEFTLSNVTAGSVRLRNGVGASETYISYKSANGTYFSYAQVNEVNTTLVVDADSSFVGSVSNVSVVEVLGDKPRIDYTDSLTSPSFLLEPQSTNLISYSEDFTTGWSNLISGSGINPVVTSNQGISPDGSLNADKVVFDLNGGTEESDYSLLNYTLSGFSNPHTLDTSIYLKSSDGNDYQVAIYNRGASVEVFTVTSQWQRFSVNGTRSNTTNNFRFGLFGHNSSNTASLLLFGAQAEQLLYATSYIPTAGSTATRAQETCLGAGNASTFNSTEGVLYAEIAALSNDLTRRIITVTDGTLNNILKLEYKNVSNQIEAVLYTGSTECLILHTLPDETEYNKIAFKYKQNDFSLFVNGIKVGTDTVGNVFTANTLNVLNFYQGNINNLYGKVKGVYVFNEALTDDELQQLTGPEYNSFAALAAAYNYTVI